MSPSSTYPVIGVVAEIGAAEANGTGVAVGSSSGVDEGGGFVVGIAVGGDGAAGA
jgi:hypothetical protein